MSAEREGHLLWQRARPRVSQVRLETVVVPQQCVSGLSLHCLLPLLPLSLLLPPPGPRLPASGDLHMSDARHHKCLPVKTPVLVLVARTALSVPSKLGKLPVVCRAASAPPSACYRALHVQQS